MLRCFQAAIIGWLLITTPVLAQFANTPKIEPVTELDESLFPPASNRRHVGHGRLFTNDFLGDRKDRWRSGSYSASRAWAWEEWQGQAPTSFGNLLELRFGGQIMTPEHLRAYVPSDRPWAGQLFFGLHTHWSQGETQFNLGGDIVMIGPQTQLDHIQKLLHDIFGAPIPSNAVLSRQIQNQIIPTVSGEVGQPIALGTSSRLRPFAEFRVGDESLLRVGADFTWGSFGLDELLARDSFTGNRYRVVRQEVPGVSFVLGADMAKVFDSVYLPSNRGYNLTDSRDRIRAGFHWQGDGRSVFYGATWMGKEFKGQRAEQIVGSVRLQFQF